MNKWIISIVALLLSGYGFSQDTVSIRYKSQFAINVSGNTSRVKLVCLIPQDLEGIHRVKHIAYSIKPSNIIEKNGNKYAEFNIFNPAIQAKVVVTADMELYRNDLSTRTKSSDMAETEIKKYLKREQYIEKDHKHIRAKAKELKANTAQQTVENIYSFVRDEVKYSGYNPEDIGAVRTLKSRKGDCTEFADLFVALCRANRIPARVVEGLTIHYGNTPLHNWAQAYLEPHGWVSFDPTPGNSSTFTEMQNKYVQLSSVRNDDIINNYHFWSYWFWGDRVDVKSSYETER